jgi:hypothetical protein
MQQLRRRYPPRSAGGAGTPKNQGLHGSYIGTNREKYYPMQFPIRWA